jgi:hypothetical protein
LPAGQETFLQNAHIFSGAHPAVGSVGVKVSFPGGKEATAWSWPFSGKVTIERSCTYTPSTRCHVVYNDFTFSIYQQFSSVQHRLLVLSRFSPYLPVYCLLRCYSPQLPHSFHFFSPTSFWAFLFFSFFFLQQVNICLGYYLPCAVHVPAILTYYFPFFLE